LVVGANNGAACPISIRIIGIIFVGLSRESGVGKLACVVVDVAGRVAIINLSGQLVGQIVRVVVIGEGCIECIKIGRVGEAPLGVIIKRTAADLLRAGYVSKAINRDAIPTRVVAEVDPSRIDAATLPFKAKLSKSC